MRIIAGIVAVMLIAAGVLWWLSATPPRWYRPPAADDVAANDLAAQVELRLAEEIHKIRIDHEPWRIRVREEQINAWLATRLPKWLEHERGIEWPPGLGTPQIRFDHDRISLSVPVALQDKAATANKRTGQRLVTLRLRPTIHDGELRLTLTDIRVGRLPVPGDPVDHLRAAFNLSETERDVMDRGLAAKLVAVITGADGFPASTELVDDRRILFRSVQFGRGTADLTASTLPPGR